MKSAIQSFKHVFIRFLRRWRVRNPKPRTFLIPAYAGLGNFVMATPMLLELKRRVPDARVYILSSRFHATGELFDAPILDPGEVAHSRVAASGPVDGVFLLETDAPTIEKLRFFMQLRRWRIATALMPFDACPAMVWWGVALAGPSHIFAHDVRTMAIPMDWTAEVPDAMTPVSIGAHESDIHLDLLDLAVPGGGRPRDYATHAAAGGEEVIRRFGLEPGGYVVVQISAANARLKTPKLWDRERWAEVISALLAAGETVVLPGDSNERALVDRFVEAYGFDRCVNLAGKTSVREISTVIKFAKLLLVHDSGLMHLGNAHGTPLVALYGPTDWNFTMPKAPTSRILRKNLSCQPCMAKMARTEEQALRDCPRDVQCMRDITVDEVLAAAREILGRSESRQSAILN